MAGSATVEVRVRHQWVIPVAGAAGRPFAAMGFLGAALWVCNDIMRIASIEISTGDGRWRRLGPLPRIEEVE